MADGVAGGYAVWHSHTCQSFFRLVQKSEYGPQQPYVKRRIQSCNTYNSFIDHYFIYSRFFETPQMGNERAAVYGTKDQKKLMIACKAAKGYGMQSY